MRFLHLWTAVVFFGHCTSGDVVSQDRKLPKIDNLPLADYVKACPLAGGLSSPHPTHTQVWRGTFCWGGGKSTSPGTKKRHFEKNNSKVKLLLLNNQENWWVLTFWSECGNSGGFAKSHESPGQHHARTAITIPENTYSLSQLARSAQSMPPPLFAKSRVQKQPI